MTRTASSLARTLSVIALFLAALTLLVTLAAFAQQTVAGQPRTKSSVPLQPWRHLATQPTAVSQDALRLPAQMQDAGVADPKEVSFVPTVPYDVVGRSSSVAIGDLDGDGHQDLVVSSNDPYSSECLEATPPGEVSVLIGKGDGIFQPAVNYNSGGAWAESVAIGDVNGDEHPDLVVANCKTDAAGEVSILFGNGDGTFQPAVSYSSGGYFPKSVAIADVDGDGDVDLIVANACQSTCQLGNGAGNVSVLLGNGDGTFQPSVSYSLGGSGGASVVVADVNGDGHPDLIVAHMCLSGCLVAGQVSVLLGNGDGTFQPAVGYGAALAETLVAVTDLNGDGHPDLVVADTGGSPESSVSVLLGKGDGTFQAPVSYGSGGACVTSVAAADLNGDGNPDVAVANCFSDRKRETGRVGVLVGNGDGTLQKAVSYNSDGYWPLSIAIGDLNGDTRPDLVVANMYACAGGCNSGNVEVLYNVFSAFVTTKVTSSHNPAFVKQPVTFTAAVTSTPPVPSGESMTFYADVTEIGTASIVNGMANLTTSFSAATTHIIRAKYLGDTYHQINTGRLAQVVARYPTSTSFTSSPNPSIYGRAITFTATVAGTGPFPPTGQVLLTWLGHTIGPFPLNSNGVATLTRSTLNVGTYPLTAAYQGDVNNQRSTSAGVSQVVERATSTATLTSWPNPSTLGQAVILRAKIMSPTVVPRGPVTFTAGATTLGTVTLSGGATRLVVSSLPAGSNTVTVTYSGNANIIGSSASVIQVVH